MAERRYGGHRREGWQGRDDSIFSDDDDRSGRWSAEHGRERGAGQDDDRGFFERAGDEVRSWFGDEEAERRREMDLRRDEGLGGFGGRDYDSRVEGGRGASPFGGGFDHGRGFGGSSRQGERSGRRGFGGGRSHWDDNYRQWREQQIARFDREYEDYCRERQQQFEQDFDSWRGSRLTEGGASGQFGGSRPGEIQQGAAGATGQGQRSQSSATGTSGALGAETAGATGSATEASAGGTGSGRGGRSRA